MNLLKRHPWIWLVLLFCLPLVVWGIFIKVASRIPMQRIDRGPVPVQKGA